MTSATESRQHAGIVRYAELRPCGAIDIDAMQGPLASRQSFAIIADNAVPGPIHISAPNGFTVTGLKQARGGPPPSEVRAGSEVLIVHSGHWRLSIGPNGEAGSVELVPGDVASVPGGLPRVLEQLADGTGFVLKIHAGDAVASTTAPVGDFDLSDGIPRLNSPASVSAELPTWVLPASSMVENPASALHAEGVEEAAVIGCCDSGDGFPPGPTGARWQHGFSVRRLTVESAAYIPAHVRLEAEVLFCQDGALEISLPDGTVMIAAGDVLLIPAQMTRAMRNTSSRRATLYVIRGSEDPAAPLFQSMPVHADLPRRDSFATPAWPNLV